MEEESRKGILRKHWPLTAAVGLLWLTLALLLALSLRQNQGRLVYALDDAYVHMAIAKHFVQRSVWGVTRYGFSSSSSSLLWTLLLSAIYFVFGVNEVAPLVLNIIFATLLLLLVYVILNKRKLAPFYSFVVLITVIYLTPLPALVFSGMEHVLQILAAIGFIYLATKVTSKEITGLLSFNRESLLLLGLAPLVTLVCYESLFFVLVVCILLVLNKRWVFSFLLGAFALFPIDVYAIMSVKRGWLWLPNSVFLKGLLPSPAAPQGFTASLAYLNYRLFSSPHVLFLAITALILYVIRFSKKSIWENNQAILAIFVLTSLLHLKFIRMDWFYRYEAYLVAMGLVAISLSLSDYLPQGFFRGMSRRLWPKYLAIVILGFLVLLPFVQRGFSSLAITAQATNNIYEQQYQMGLFLKDFYEGSAVAANDIGAINYLANIDNLDLVGLGSLEVMVARDHGHYGREEIYGLARSKGTKIAIVYDSWFQRYGGLPPAWIKVAEWKISNNVVLGGDTVSFYAVDPSEAETLVRNLRAFAPRLPGDVKQAILYRR